MSATEIVVTFRGNEEEWPEGMPLPRKGETVMLANYDWPVFVSNVKFDLRLRKTFISCSRGEE